MHLCTGKGWDRHLFALKNLAASHVRPQPALFRDESYRRAMQHSLSTSTLEHALVESGGFAPPAPECFGIGYGSDADRSGCVLTAFTGAFEGRADTQLLALEIQRALDDLLALT